MKQKRDGDTAYYSDDSGNFFYKALPYAFGEKKGAENDNKRSSPTIIVAN